MPITIVPEGSGYRVYYRTNHYVTRGTKLAAGMTATFYRKQKSLKPDATRLAVHGTLDPLASFLFRPGKAVPRPPIYVLSPEGKRRLDAKKKAKR